MRRRSVPAWATSPLRHPHPTAGRASSGSTHPIRSDPPPAGQLAEAGFLIPWSSCTCGGCAWCFPVRAGNGDGDGPTGCTRWYREVGHLKLLVFLLDGHSTAELTAELTKAYCCFEMETFTTILLLLLVKHVYCVQLCFSGPMDRPRVMAQPDL
jgi:hypothetical protein